MPTGTIEIRKNRKAYISGTDFEVTDNSLRNSGWGALQFADIDKELDIEYEVVNNRAIDVRRYAAVPESVRNLLHIHGCDHPGLALDKFIHRSSGQAFVKHALQTVVEVNNTRPSQQAHQGWYQCLRNRWLAVMKTLNAEIISAETIGPFTLHLSRASALENAGICLHPLYGFAYLPGSGLKGMARAYATTVAGTSAEEIEEVFGNEPGESKKDKQRAGAVVFHDAWPEKWPQLIVDIVNNHHPEYYQARPTDNDRPPGDWENPNPVYFLAVPSETVFEFALSLRRPNGRKELLERAKEWLVGALCHLGAGAKTAAGYGSFRCLLIPPPHLPPSVRATFEATLELVTPAFFAGANQQKEDCDLRPATLRGLLRWWWRTMHGGYVDVKTLRALEAAIWGDTNIGGAVRVEVQPQETVQAIPVPGKRIQKDKKGRDVLRRDIDFAREQKLESPTDQKTTQGLLYLMYGMDEMPAGKPNERKLRHCILPGVKWKVLFTARRAFYRRPNAAPEEGAKRLCETLVLEQAKMALWLLCHYGGIGSKARNGFGSFADISDYTLDKVKHSARELRSACGISEERPQFSQTCAIVDMLEPIEVQVPWKNYWFILDQLGFSIQSFAKKYKRHWWKESLGLPKKIGTSDKDGAKDRGYSRSFDELTHQQIVWVGQKHPYLGKRNVKDMRHASPVYCHVARSDSGQYSVRLIAFPSSVLPDHDTSHTMLTELLEDVKMSLDRAIQSHPDPGLSPSPRSTGSYGSMPGPRSVPEPVTRAASVRVKFLGPHDKLKGTYWVQEEGKKRGLLKYGTPPVPLPTEGTEIEVYPTNNNPNSPEYRWDKPVEQAQKGRDHGRPGRGGGPRGRR